MYEKPVEMTTSDARPSRGEGRERQVRQIFSEIAPRYDLLNHLLSAGIDRRWRTKAVRRLGWEEAREGLYLDACAGTFDLSVSLAEQEGFRGRIVASDFAQPMMVEGREKLAGLPVEPVCGDTLRLPFPDGTFDGAMVAFGIRNLADLERGVAELHRVLRSGSRLVILEFTLPPNPLVRALYMVYFTRVLPLVGRIVSGHPWAYSYLPASVREFPGPGELGDLLRDVGFREADHSLLTLGIAAIHVAVK